MFAYSAIYSERGLVIPPPIQKDGKSFPHTNHETYRKSLEIRDRVTFFDLSTMKLEAKTSDQKLG